VTASLNDMIYCNLKKKKTNTCPLRTNGIRVW